MLYVIHSDQQNYIMLLTSTTGIYHLFNFNSADNLNNTTNSWPAVAISYCPVVDNWKGWTGKVGEVHMAASKPNRQ